MRSGLLLEETKFAFLILGVMQIAIFLRDLIPSLVMQRQGGIGSVFIVLCVFLLFTITLGAGLVLYQDVAAALPSSGELQSVGSQAMIIGILFLFIAGALLFLVSTARWMGQQQ